ncbi:MAG: hypothetical protein UV09_C0016G0031 [Candidatus Gottesmanbacteria bacterium GW2011_GWA2_42_18]|uniref:Uncharacterized protein n=2 Tax=Candidatus Gottesmaniibacteriota TaxID=1752720 RepID=A0A0G1BJS4_9BACT|nr:MAG: hypothetical protein UV09_C0016G0031 [Candidatus Gottesmanbacteria bacterium GW2011_GWA2_42_18]
MKKLLFFLLFFLIAAVFPLKSSYAIDCSPTDDCIECSGVYPNCTSECTGEWRESPPNCDGGPYDTCNASCATCNIAPKLCYKCRNHPPPETPTPTVTPTPPRQHLCERLTCEVGSTPCAKTTLSRGQSVTLKSKFTKAGNAYWFALYNADNPYPPPNGTSQPMCVLPGFSGDINEQSEACPYIPGTQTRMNHLIYREDSSTSNGNAQKKLPYGKIFVPDQNFKDNNGLPKIPSQVSFNAYMIDENGILTYPEFPCVKSISRAVITVTPTKTPTPSVPTKTPTKTPTPVPQIVCRQLEIIVTNRKIPSVTPVPVKVGDKVAFKGYGSAKNTEIRFMKFDLYYKSATKPVFTKTVPVTPPVTNSLYTGDTLKYPYEIKQAGPYRVTVKMIR